MEYKERFEKLLEEFRFILKLTKAQLIKGDYQDLMYHINTEYHAIFGEELELTEYEIIHTDFNITENDNLVDEELLYDNRVDEMKKMRHNRRIYERSGRKRY